MLKTNLCILTTVLRNCGRSRLRTIRLLLFLFLLLFIIANMWGAETHDHAHDSDDPCAGHNHAMVFHSCVCAEILFNGWQTTNAVQLFGSAVVIFVASVLYEAFKYFREELTRRPVPGVTDENGKTQLSTKKMMLNMGHVTQTVLHLLQSTLSYLLMLMFMSYNVWLCLALVLGLTFGYFLFGWRRSVNDANELCC